MNEGFKERFARALTVLLIGIIVVGGIATVWPVYQRTKALKRQDAELTRKIEEKKREIDRLIEFQRRFKTDSDFVENIARQNHRVFPGELVFIFDD